MDDIVERLRAAAHSGDLALGQSFDCMAVAEEIERLRAAGDALIAAIRNHDLREQHIKAWEARRG